MRVDSGGGTPCFGDGECPDDQFCALSGVSGICTPGCREDASNCDPGQVCDPATRICATPPCDGDASCPTGQYCDMATNACTEGCRVEGTDCPTVDGRERACDPATHTCIDLSACCAAAGGCELVAGAADCAGGQVLEGATSCEPDPCGTPCPNGDADCGAEQFCNDDGRCQDGCRLEVGSCPEQSCDPNTNTCIDQACATDEDCPNRFQFCDDGACLDGCRENADCNQANSETCVDGACVPRCDPMANGCGANRYCDAELLICRDECGDHDDCEAGEACNFETNQCEAGACRDDRTEPGDDLVDGAVAIELGNRDVDGFRFGEGTGTLCGGDSDFFSVRLEQGERIRVRLVFDDAENLDVTLTGDAIDDPIVAATQNVPEQIIYPPAGVVENATTYFIEVRGAGGRAGTAYTVEVTVAPAEQPCFPDRLDEAGDDTFQTANQIGGLQRYEQRLLSICPRNDEDWFTLPLSLNDGLRVEVVTGANEEDLIIELYSQTRVGGIGGGGPNHQDVVAEQRAGQVAYVIDLAQDSGSFSNEPWFIRIKSSDPGGFPDYDLTVVRQSRECIDDGFEDNDGIADGTDLDGLAGVGQAGEVPYTDEGIEVPGPANSPLFICTFDDDYYCFDLDAQDGFEAWAVGDGVAGDLEVRIVDDRGQALGEGGTLTLPNAPIDPARARGVQQGRHCAVVDGLAAAQGPYRLFVRRFSAENICEMPDNNNVAARATPLEDVGGNVRGQRFEYQAGAVCGDELDWYSFPVAQGRSRLCVTMDGFRNDFADLELEVFRDAPDNNPDNRCMSSAQCDGGAECIQGFCQAPISRSTTLFDAELVDLNKQIVRNGGYLVKVSTDGAADGAAYRVAATVTPEEALCPEDWQERGDPNNDRQTATPLGSGQIAICDSWLCEGEGADWYSVTVPAGQDRTVFIEFQSNVDGRLFLDYEGPSADPDDMFGGFRRSEDPVGNAQCINIRGGAEDNEVLIRVFDNLVRPDGDTRVDYNLRIVPTDMSGLAPGNPNSQYMDHQGECLTLGGGELGTCPFENPFAAGCWPFVELP